LSYSSESLETMSLLLLLSTLDTAISIGSMF
jgi:hypothetical protein